RARGRGSSLRLDHRISRDHGLPRSQLNTWSIVSFSPWRTMVCARRAWLLGARRIRAINDDRPKPLCQLRCGTEQVGWAKRISFSGIIAISLTFLLRTLIKAMFHSAVILQRQVGLFSAGNLRHSPTKSRGLGPPGGRMRR